MMPELAAATPAAWLDAACEHWQELLLDHACCEKKAASTALAMIFAYPERESDNLVLSRLAREELRHFEQVSRWMRQLGVPFRRLAPGRYASGLRAAMRTSEPDRRLDWLLTGALIEARSCERFELLSQRLAAPLAGFYGELARVEARHGELYLRMAAAAEPGRKRPARTLNRAPAGWQERLAQLAAVEAALVTEPDELLRFHSGDPRGSCNKV
jgi:tRNA-(ms[2]io[6]A)-hydroxylase